MVFQYGHPPVVNPAGRQGGNYMVAAELSGQRQLVGLMPSSRRPQIAARSTGKADISAAWNRR
eukprot:2588480-Alexandrium_andersonii.AAC.1